MNPAPYDVIIIGSGGGAKIAQALDRLGKRVALIEKDRAGGTCLNRGCIPSKMLIHPAGLARRIRAFRKLRIDAEMKSVDFEALVASVNAYTDDTSDGIANNFNRAEHVDYFGGAARFISSREVAVGEHRISAPVIIIATGSRPFIPAIPGLAGTPYMTSTEALRNRALPRHLIVLGGGYIAAELGGAYHGFGSEVTFVARGDILKREDPEIVTEFLRDFSSDKTLHTHTTVDEVAHDGQNFHLRCRDREGHSINLTGDALLVATGVVPNTDELGLEAAGVEVDQRGFVRVNDHLETTAPGIFALGDAAGNYLFRHSVNFEAEYWVNARFLAPEPFPIEYPPVPSAVFTHPEIASVGLTEPEARAAGIDYLIGRAAYPSCAMAVARGLEHGLVKLIFAKDSGRLLGAHLTGEEASTMIQELVLALTHRLTAAAIYRQIYIHPAFPEVIRNALRDALRQLDPRGAVVF
ncbi:MAG: dihydrolipoyl dehydrogenase family protein [Kiritimatiellia bacterium]